MNTLDIIEKYYKKDSDLYKTLIWHSTDVMLKAVSIAKNHPELNADGEFIREAAMLHDIGIFLTDAPSIHCFGIAPYLSHGYIGAEILIQEGFPQHALACERHTGTGISLEEIISKDLPLPKRDMIPISIEEQIICFADCFYSKTHLGEEKTIPEIRKKLARFGERSVEQFDKWCVLFL